MNMFKAMIVHIISIISYDSYMNMFKAMIVHIISTLI